MTEIEKIHVAALADKIDEAIRAATHAEGGLVVPAIAILLGRYVAYEAGAADRIGDGLNMVWSMMRMAAIEEACKLYAPKDDQGIGALDAATSPEDKE